MQFDIKYAYFNFLQSIPYALSEDPALCKLRNGKAHFDNSGDETGSRGVDDDEND